MPLAPTIRDSLLIDLDPVRLIPMMVSRIVISLKKFASERRGHLSVDVPSKMPMSVQDGYNSHPVEGIPLSVLKGERI